MTARRSAPRRPARRMIQDSVPFSFLFASRTATRDGRRGCGTRAGRRLGVPGASRGREPARGTPQVRA